MKRPGAISARALQRLEALPRLVDGFEGKLERSPMDSESLSGLQHLEDSDGLFGIDVVGFMKSRGS
jgi:hypothetical protein